MLRAVRLFRFGDPGRERIGLLSDKAGRVDVSGFGEDYDEAFFGTDGLSRLARWYEAHAAECPSVGADERVGPVVARPSKIVCVGLNYRDHAAETGAKVPDEPMLFTKSTTALARSVPRSNSVKPFRIPVPARSTACSAASAKPISRC